MKTKLIHGGLLLAALVAVGVTGCETEKQEQARIGKEQAQQTALARVPGGTVKEAELEKEKGQLVWSFDIATADSKDATEVNVDAVTGDVVNVEQESKGEDKD